MVKTKILVLLLLSFNTAFSQKHQILEEECTCEDVALILNLKMDCDTIFRSNGFNNCQGQFSKKDTIDGEIYYRELIHVKTDSYHNLYADHEYIQDFELIKWKSKPDTLSKEVYSWFKSPFTREDTLVFVYTERIVFIEDPMTGDKIQKISRQSAERFCSTCNPREFDYKLNWDITKNIFHNEVSEFSKNIGVLFSMAVIGVPDHIISFYEIGLQVRDKNPEMWQIWEQYHKRLLQDYWR